MTLSVHRKVYVSLYLFENNKRVFCNFVFLSQKCLLFWNWSHSYDKIVILSFMALIYSQYKSVSVRIN
jgi:hypothetical protein